MLFYLKFYAISQVLTDALSAYLTKIEGIEGNPPLRAAEISRNLVTIALAVFFPTSSRVRSGFSGLPWWRSCLSERKPSKIHDSAFLNIFHIYSPDNQDSSFQMYRTHRHTDSEKTGLKIYRQAKRPPQGGKNSMLNCMKFYATYVFFISPQTDRKLN